MWNYKFPNVSHFIWPSAITTPKLAGNGNRTFALDKADDRRHGVFGRPLDTHMDVIGHHMAFDDPAFLLPGQLMEDWTELTTNLPKQLLTAPFRNKHDVIFAISARMRQALI
jgi:hypothetical protein